MFLTHVSIEQKGAGRTNIERTYGSTDMVHPAGLAVRRLAAGGFLQCNTIVTLGTVYTRKIHTVTVGTVFRDTFEREWTESSLAQVLGPNSS